MTLQKFVELTATNPAKAYGLHPRKGTIAIGSDADLVIWDERDITLSNAQLHHAVDYTPYEGMRLKAWPGLTLAAAKWCGTADLHRPRRPRPVPALRHALAAAEAAAERPPCACC